MKYNNILETIGNTPHVKLIAYLDPTIMCDSERANPGASIKDRIALAMIEDAEEKGY
jgi:cysteine synthase A